MSKGKWTPVTDAAEIDELLTDPGDISKPMTYKPNGQLWVETEQYRLWRAARHE